MKRLALALVAVLLVLAGGWGTWFWATLDRRMPTDEDYRAANAYIAAHLQPGDVIVLAPSYAERGRAFLTAAPVMAGYDLAHDEYPGTKRQWLVALPDVPRFSLADARHTLEARGPASEAGLRIGHLWIEPFSIAGPEQAFSFTEHIGEAQVSIAGPRGETCRAMAGGRHQCSHADWNHVAAEWHEVQERPFRCVWAHPVDEGPLQIRFSDVPLARAVRGRAAFTDQAPSYARGQPVHLQVKVGDTVVGTSEFTNRPDLQPFEQLLPPGLPARGDVTLTISTPQSAMRHFCFDAWLGP